MRQVLLIAYYFPPSGGSGGVRIVKFAKYLAQFGWQPTVLTVAGGDSFVMDDSMLAELPDSVRIVRAPSFELIKTTQAKRVLDRVRSGSSFSLRQWFVRFAKSIYFSIMIPDDKRGWLWPAVSKAVRLHRQQLFDALFVSSPPQTDLLIGRRLKRRLDIPVALDYRDAWTTNQYKMRVTNRISALIQRAMERRTLRCADAITIVSPRMRQDLLARGLLADDFPLCQTVPNGFDPQDFQNLKFDVSTSHFDLVYTGSCYADRTPEPFFCAVHSLVARLPKIRQHLRISFYGSIYPRHLALVADLGLQEYVHVIEHVPHHKAVAAQASASLLLLIVGLGEGKEVLTGKVFEYFAARKPILATVPLDGDAAALIQKTRTGVVVAPDDVEGISRCIEASYQQWISGEMVYDPDRSEVQCYSRINQAQQLAALLDRIVQD